MLIEHLNDKVVGEKKKNCCLWNYGTYIFKESLHWKNIKFRQYKYSHIILDKNGKHHANTAKATRQKVQQGNQIQSYGDDTTENPAGL